MPPGHLLHRLIVASSLLAATAQGGVVINEILYRPGTGFPEVTEREFIELHNTDTATVNVSGWALTAGVDFVIPAGTQIPAGGYLVIGATPAAVETAYTITGVLGPWTGGLSNNSERIRLSKPGLAPGTWDEVDEVTYASEGDWATRVRETQFNGWDWSTPANLTTANGGRSMELRNPAISNDNGQNWAPSTAAAGATPGAANSVKTTNVPPILHDVKHSPGVPKSTDPVRISCELTDENTPATLTATLHWRNATTVTPGAFQQLAMIGDGTGKFTATLPPHTNLAIIEFYLEASDGTNTRTWPSPTSEGQNANCQYQVDNEVTNSSDSYYRLVLTGAENAAYAQTAPNDSFGNKIDRQFNTTIVSTRGTETTIRYRSSIRFRGNSSRDYQFKPLRVSIPNDDRWDGVTDFNLNPRYSWLQHLGMRMFEAAGLASCYTLPVEMRRNGIEYTATGGQDFGKWVRMEEINGDMTDTHWPNARGGSLYKKGRPDEFWRATANPPNNPNGLIDGWSKQNNSGANDWTDLTGFFQVWQAAAAPHFTGANPNDVFSGDWAGTALNAAELANVETVSDLDQWALWFAVMTLLEDNETNISNGQDDDYDIYFVPSAGGQRRAQLLPHDLDTVFGRGDTPLNPNDRGLYDMTDDGSVFETILPLIGNNTTAGNAAFRQKYHDAIRKLLGGVFDADISTNPNPTFYQLVDTYLGNWVNDATRTQIKTFMTQRQAYLLDLIPDGVVGGEVATPIIPPPATSNTTVTSAAGSLVIHEVLANNVSAHNNGGTFPDVIELRNLSGADIDLAGKSLSDDSALKTKFVFPANTVLTAGSSLVLYADSPSAAPGTHLGFALDQDGDQVFLYDSLGSGQTLLDSISFGPQPPDFSIGRTGALLDTWALCVPSIGGANTPVATFAAPNELRINEWAGNPDYLISDDFVELYNPATQPVGLGGMSVTDDVVNAPTKHIFPALSFIGPGGFLRLNARGNDASPGNFTELPFGIEASFGSLALLGANGTTVDRVDVLGQAHDVSLGRSPDGSATIVRFEPLAAIPTPGAANTQPPAGVLALLNDLRVSEFLFRPNSLEFVELQNIGSTTLDLSGVQFTSGLTYTFPAGTTLAPGAFLVVCKDRTAFQVQYGPGVPLAPGAFTGSLDNAGETIALQPPPPWNVNILSFEYENDWFNDPTANHSYTTVDAPDTAARDWDEKETWKLSQSANGTPGTDEPPNITSSLAVQAFAGGSFHYQIETTKSPTSYNAAPLPDGLIVDPQTGVISGSTTSLGTFNVSISATSPYGSDTETLQITVTLAPMAGLEWNMVSPPMGNIPFTATLRAVDSVGQTVTSYNGPASVSASQLKSQVIFTEFGTTAANPDFFEIQNVGEAPANTTGWFVLTSRSSVAGGGATPTTSWTLPASLAARQIVGATDNAGNLAPNETYYGTDIDWPGNGPNGWAMLVDDTGNIRDFCAWGYSAAQIAGISFTFNGFSLSVGTEWSGTGAAAPGGSQSLSRNGSADNNNGGDWTVGATPNPRGTENSGLNFPYGSQTQLTVTPDSVTLVNGVWTGQLTILEVWPETQLRATIPNYPAASSNVFAVTSPTSNTAPGFTKGLDQTVNEDAGPRTVANWATGIYPGATSESSQTVSFLVQAGNPALFSVQPTVSSSGTLTYTPAPNQHGTSTVTVQAKDNGGTANGGVDTSLSQMFAITVLDLNDTPSFTPGSTLAVSQIAGPQTVPNWATNISAGPANEAGQALTFIVTTNSPDLFTTAPAIATDGTLSFTPNPARSGAATVTVRLRDDGGTANGGNNQSAPVNFTITVAIINDPPVFVPGSDVTVSAGQVYSQTWATGISPGGADESAQTVNFIVGVDRLDLFAVLPKISPAGLLTFTAAHNATGEATITTSLKDNGGLANGGDDESNPVTFKIRILSFGAIAGPQYTLIHPPAGESPSHERTGFLKLVLTKSGAFSGSVVVGGKKTAIRGKIDGTGTIRFGKSATSLTIARKNLPALSLTPTLDVAGGGVFTGKITENGNPYAEFSASRAKYDGRQKLVPTTILDPLTDKGHYATAFPALPAPNGGFAAEAFPQGDGWGSMTVSKTGTVTVRGQLADGTPYVFASALIIGDAVPLYSALYSAQGSVSGTMQLRREAGSDADGAGLWWFRPPMLTPRPAKYYSPGWTTGIQVDFLGARILPKQTPIFPDLAPADGDGNAVVDLTDAGISPAKAVNVDDRNRVAVLQAGTDKLKIALALPSGSWSGSFVRPSDGKLTKFKGAILRQAGYGTGFYLDAAGSKRVQIEPAP